MKVEIDSNINISKEDPANKLQDVICKVKLTNNDSFTGRLIMSLDRELWFESKKGRVWMVRRDLIETIEPIHLHNQQEEGV